MTIFTITVTDPAGMSDTRQVNVPAAVPTNLENEENLSVADIALWLAAPEACPFDCDYCRG